MNFKKLHCFDMSVYLRRDIYRHCCVFGIDISQMSTTLRWQLQILSGIDVMASIITTLVSRPM